MLSNLVVTSVPLRGLWSPSRREIRRACVSEVFLWDCPDRLNTFLRRPVRLTRSVWVLGSGFLLHLSSIHSAVIFVFAGLLPWQNDKRSSLGVVLMETLCVCLVEKMFTNLRKRGWRKTHLCDYHALLVQKVDSAIQHSHNCSYKACIF